MFQKKVERFFPCTSIIFLLLINVHSLRAQCCLPENNSLKQLVQSKELQSAHVGVYVYDDSSKKVIADYQSDKYFVPASNTKLFSLYAGMKYLGDSITGIRYGETDTTVYIIPTADPSFLHPDYLTQPVFDFLKKTKKKIVFEDMNWAEKPLGPGWAWDDENEDYSVERSSFPIYGNFIRWSQQTTRTNFSSEPTPAVFSSPEITWPVRFTTDTLPKTFQVSRLADSNVFIIRTGTEQEIIQDVPFITNGLNTAVSLLKDTIGKTVFSRNLENILKQKKDAGYTKYPNGVLMDYTLKTIYSRPADSIFVPMMYRSDNFFAEQTLLMVCSALKMVMNDESLISYLLTKDLKDLPQPPNWVDGSGLSRYNLFTPQDFVTLLIHFKNEFGMDRMKRILPTGGSGTIKNYYKNDSGSVYMKTGSMTGVLCISGYLYTNKKHLLEFSILVNNNNGGSSVIRRQVETFVESLKRNN